VGDAAAEIPRLLSAARDVLANITALTASDSALGNSLRNVQSVTEKLDGPGGAMGLIAGEDRKAQELLRNANSLIVKADALVGNADRRVFGDKGIATDAQAAVVQLNGLLADARASLKKMDAVLAEAQAVGANAREATEDLGALRADIDSNLRRIEELVNEINRKWPFKRETEIKLP
jgi:phospholipid/cholesterol/gamma-HCH transport system substrate-binding protein